MNVLIIGGGGREHAIAWALQESPLHPHLYIAPGNPGTANVGDNVTLHDVTAAIQFAKSHQVELTVVGPEQPLVEGWADAFREAGLRVFGPDAAAAEIEGSKVFAKDFMQRHAIPTAGYRTFKSTQYEEARAFLEEIGVPVVLKADGLAAGKGVLIALNMDEAVAGLNALLVEQRFGDASASVVIEEFMTGEEVSVFVLTDGERYLTLAPAQDHKRVGEGDTGLNTGGMGAYAPAPVATPAIMEQVRTSITEPTLRGLAAEGRRYVGFLYLGLMVTEEGPRVVEYNCRLGDPEAQVILPLLQDDLLTLILRLLKGEPVPAEASTNPGSAACVIMASRGYPQKYDKGFVISGLDQAAAEKNVLVFQAGTGVADDGTLRTNGGRVLGVTGLGQSLAGALETAYQAIGMVDFKGAQFRRDIGQKGLAHLVK